MSHTLTAIRLNYGCDKTRLPGYVGIDVRATPATDYVLPAWDTSPWSAGSVDEIYSRHMLEHLDPHDARRALRAWRKVLRPDGILRLIVPDIEFHARQLLGLANRWPGDPQRDLAHAMTSLYGWREAGRGGDEEDAHRWGYTLASLRTLLTETGFADISRVASGPDSEPWHLQVTACKPRESEKTATVEFSAGESVPAYYARERVWSVLKAWRGLGKIVVFGAGCHTRKVLPALEEHADLILGIADDAPSAWGQHFGRWNVLPPGECIGPEVKGILVSSDMHQERIAARLRAEYASRCEILTFYPPTKVGQIVDPDASRNCGEGRMRILLTTGADDEFVERIESSLADAAGQRGADLLLAVEGRNANDRSIPTIDLEELVDTSELSASLYERVVNELGRIVEDTRWYALTRDYASDRRGIEDKLVAAAVAIDRILNQYRPHVVLTWNGLLGVRAVMADRAQRAGIPVLFCERGALPGSWCADSLGVNAAGSLAVPPMPADLQSMLNTPLSQADRDAAESELNRTAQAGASAWAQADRRGAQAWREKLGIAPDQRVLFFPMQVDADTNMRFFSPHFTGSLPALKAIAAAVARMPGWFLLVKPHPKGLYPTGAVERAMGAAGRSVAGINLHDALALSSLVVTINSTVACEAAWSGKPVLQLGNGILSAKGIVTEYDASRPLHTQLLMAIEQWAQDATRYERGLQFYRYLRTSYLLQAGDDADTNRLMERIERLTSIADTSAAHPSAQAVAAAHVWLPAKRVLDRMAAYRPRPERVLLVGYGRNARRLLSMARAHPVGSRLSWSVWDDAREARAQAECQGLDVCRPESMRGDKTLLLVTPRNPAALASRLDDLGYRAGREYWTLFSDTAPMAVMRVPRLPRLPGELWIDKDSACIPTCF